ncbi:MAG: hypothetical protein ACLR8P_08745 [Clostridium fessum]
MIRFWSMRRAPAKSMFRRDPSMVKSWNEKGPVYVMRRCAQILDRARCRC